MIAIILFALSVGMQQKIVELKDAQEELVRKEKLAIGWGTGAVSRNEWKYLATV